MDGDTGTAALKAPWINVGQQTHGEDEPKERAQKDLEHEVA
jgi:hypothetical protein